MEFFKKAVICLGTVALMSACGSGGDTGSTNNSDSIPSTPTIGSVSETTSAFEVTDGSNTTSISKSQSATPESKDGGVTHYQYVTGNVQGGVFTGSDFIAAGGNEGSSNFFGFTGTPVSVTQTSGTAAFIGNHSTTFGTGGYTGGGVGLNVDFGAKSIKSYYGNLEVDATFTDDGNVTGSAKYQEHSSTLNAGFFSNDVLAGAYKGDSMAGAFSTTKQ